MSENSQIRATVLLEVMNHLVERKTWLSLSHEEQSGYEKAIRELARIDGRPK